MNETLTARKAFDAYFTLIHSVIDACIMLLNSVSDIINIFFDNTNAAII